MVLIVQGVVILPTQNNAPPKKGSSSYQQHVHLPTGSLHFSPYTKHHQQKGPPPWLVFRPWAFPTSKNDATTPHHTEWPSWLCTHLCFQTIPKWLVVRCSTLIYPASLRISFTHQHLSKSQIPIQEKSIAITDFVGDHFDCEKVLVCPDICP